MTGWWVHELWQNGQGAELVSWIFWVIAAITLHELAHGWAAIYEGDDTPIVTGHMTANPIVHMGVPSIVVFLLLGIAWGLMPINPHRFRHGKWGRILVSAAGPVMNLVLAFINLTILAFVIDLEGEQTDLTIFLFTGGFLNFVLFAFNLLPIPPLDGSVIISNLSPTVARWYSHPQASIAGLLFLLFLIWTNAASFAFSLAHQVAGAYVGILYTLFSS